MPICGWSITTWRGNHLGNKGVELVRSNWSSVFADFCQLGLAPQNRLPAFLASFFRGGCVFLGGAREPKKIFCAWALLMACITFSLLFSFVFIFGLGFLRSFFCSIENTGKQKKTPIICSDRPRHNHYKIMIWVYSLRLFYA